MGTKKLKTFDVCFELSGHGFLKVKAENEAEATELAWELYVEGKELEEVEWEAAGASASEVRSKSGD